ncbi:clostripain-related cysteine peptidase [uncultured Thiodictyon sp.]|uniref:clostripain-related cysteine peptidase n=1 Tax=uncultured Thiodictyon sp. TaxID=1846217 RepID=UPI0025D4E244|nr:clostripain-related cysteine peptidase [uncultured Thiodictyon sp.]
MPSKAKWTVLTYIAAHNNLDQFGTKSLMEILGVGSTSDVVQGALYDSKVGAGRYIMGDPGGVEWQKQLGRFDSGDPDELIATAKWLFVQYPAERYGLVLWSHGSGWEPSEIEEIAKEARPSAQADSTESKERSVAPGSRALFRSTLRSLLKPEKRTERAILFDDGTGHSLDTLELSRVAGAIAETVGQPLELLGMDACLMANLEVAYEVRKAVRYFAASEELVPGHSWPYKEIFGALRANPDLGGAEFAKLVVDRYVRFYTANPPAGGDVTKVALDLGRIDEVVAATDRLAAALCEDRAKLTIALWEAQFAAQQRETKEGQREPSKFDYHLWDLRSVASSLAGAAAASDPVRQAAAKTAKVLAPDAGPVLAEGHRGDWFDGIGGLSVYLMPRDLQRISPSYKALAFAKDTRWDEMLESYHA